MHFSRAFHHIFCLACLLSFSVANARVYNDVVRSLAVTFFGVSREFSEEVATELETAMASFQEAYYETAWTLPISNFETNITIIGYQKDVSGLRNRGDFIRVVYDQAIRYEANAPDIVDSFAVATVPFVSMKERSEFVQQLNNSTFLELTMISSSSAVFSGVTQSPTPSPTISPTGIFIDVEEEMDAQNQENVGDDDDDDDEWYSPLSFEMFIGVAAGGGVLILACLLYVFYSCRKYKKEESQKDFSCKASDTIASDQEKKEKENDREIRFILAPPGKLGVVIYDNPNGGAPVVDSVKSTSTISHEIQAGDLIHAVDEEDVRAFPAMTVSELIASKSSKEQRKLTISRFV